MSSTLPYPRRELNPLHSRFSSGMLYQLSYEVSPVVSIALRRRMDLNHHYPDFTGALYH